MSRPAHAWIPSAVMGPILAVLVSGFVHADPPQITNVQPYGVPRGVVTDLLIQGSGLTGQPRLVTPIAVTVEPPPEPKEDPASWTLRVTVSPDVAVGVYPLRVATDDGISNPILMAVGQFPQAVEVEPNNAPETATPIPGLVVVEGQASGNDVDYFRFPGKAGQRIAIDAACNRIGSGVDPQIRLTTATGKYVASADDSPGLMTDARLVADLPIDGDYLVEISDSRYQGGGRAVYRLTVGPVPVAEAIYPLGGRAGETVGFEVMGGTLPAGPVVVAATVPDSRSSKRFFPHLTDRRLGSSSPGEPSVEIELPGPLEVGWIPELREPSGTNASPLRAAPPVVINGRIDPPANEDRFTIVVSPGQKYRVRVSAASLGSALDAHLRVLKPDGSEIVQGDDTTLKIPIDDPTKPVDVVSPDPSVEFTPPEGVTEVTLVLRDLSGRGGPNYGYRIVTEPALPGFDVDLAAAQISVPREGVANVPVQVVRRDFNGPITLSIADPPAGLTVREGIVPEGQTVGVLTVAAAVDADFGPVELAIVGRGELSGAALTATARKTLVFASQGGLPLNHSDQIGLAAAPAQRRPIALTTPADPIEVVHGLGGKIPVTVDRREEAAKVELTLNALPLPGGVSVPEAKIAPDADSAEVAVNITPDAPLGRISLAMNAKGKLAEQDRTFDVPASTLEIVRPAAIELSAGEIQVKPGANAELNGTLQRRGAFQEAVTIKIDGLPAGVTVEPVTVPGDQKTFTLVLTASSDAAEATATAQVAPAFKIGDKDYTTPPTALAVKVVP